MKSLLSGKLHERDTLWSEFKCDENMTHAKSLSDRILRSGNPYQGVDHDSLFPNEEQIVFSSSILGIMPELREKTYAAEIATDEFSHYLAQTYFFEVLGFQIIGDTAAHCPRISHMHDLASQAIDEARHMQIYLELLFKSNSTAIPAISLPKIHSSVIQQGTFIEKLVKGFLVLESTAIGLFSARASTYGDCALSRLDLLILHEEVAHQNAAKMFASELIREQRCNLRDILEIMREGISELSSSMLPTDVLLKHGLPCGHEVLRAIDEHGIVARQKAVSRANLRKVIRDLNEVAIQDRRRGAMYA
jgi:hypothetical protein